MKNQPPKTAFSEIVFHQAYPELGVWMAGSGTDLWVFTAEGVLVVLQKATCATRPIIKGGQGSLSITNIDPLYSPLLGDSRRLGTVTFSSAAHLARRHPGLCRPDKIFQTAGRQVYSLKGVSVKYGDRGATIKLSSPQKTVPCWQHYPADRLRSSFVEWYLSSTCPDGFSARQLENLVELAPKAFVPAIQKRLGRLYTQHRQTAFARARERHLEGDDGTDRYQTTSRLTQTMKEYITAWHEAARYEGIDVLERPGPRPAQLFTLHPDSLVSLVKDLMYNQK